MVICLEQIANDLHMV